MSRREHVPFDPRFFERQAAAQGSTPSRQATFEHIYETNHWAGPDSVSGEGAGRAQTQRLEAALPPLLRALGVRTLLDAPCGAFGWMQHVDLTGVRYVGADIVEALVTQNQARYGTPERRFVHLDLCADLLPTADLLLCRDALVHLAFTDIEAFLTNLRRSPIAYLLTTTFPACEANEDITTGDWRPLNLERAPFGFPKPLRLLNEGCTEGGGRFQDKSLGLWRVDALLGA